jgi:prevent-host-death family protein
MKTVAASQLKSELNEILGAAQKERVLVTRGGKPSAVLIGVEHYDDEDWTLARSPEFWRMIESRRKETKSISLEELEARIQARLAKKSSPRKPKRPKSKSTRGRAKAGNP